MKKLIIILLFSALLFKFRSEVVRQLNIYTEQDVPSINLMASNLVSEPKAARKNSPSNNAGYLTETEKSIIDEMNIVRANPGSYAEKHLVPLLNQFEGKILIKQDGTRLRTIEGASAVKECIESLSNQSPVSPLQASKGMSLGARDHVKDQALNGDTGHKGRNGSMPADRVNKYGKWGMCVAENIHYGMKDPKEIIISLLIDDGVKSRGHRNTILSPKYTLTGVSFGEHLKYHNMCVITYAGAYSEN